MSDGYYKNNDARSGEVSCKKYIRLLKLVAFLLIDAKRGKHINIFYNYFDKQIRKETSSKCAKSSAINSVRVTKVSFHLPSTEHWRYPQFF